MHCWQTVSMSVCVHALRSLDAGVEGILCCSQVIYMTGWSPHEAQQRAMRRGSATVSFEDLQAKLGERKAGSS